MNERSSFDSFEQRIAADLERYVAPAADPTPAAETAEVAMRPRGLVVRARNASRPRRFLLLGLAAALLLPAAYIGAMATRPPTPNPVIQIQPPQTDDPLPTTEPSTPEPSAAAPLKDSVSILVRRDDGPEPGLSIFAVRPDGIEVLVRKVPDSIAPGPGTLSEWGTVSESGWLAVTKEVYGGPWPMILIDLGDESATPWVVNEANLGGIGPRWGPTGLVAASTGGAGVIVADPTTHSTRRVTVGGGLVGGGPSIVWSADGRGIVDSKGEIWPIDGGTPDPGVARVFDPRGSYGPGLAWLRICEVDADCTGDHDGRVERVELDGSTQTIWRQDGDDRVLAAGFGGRVDEYWLSLDHDKGRQVTLVHLHDGRQDAVATVNRMADWQYVAAPVEAPDHSALLVWIDIGAKPAAVLVPLTGDAPTYHTGQFAGFVDSSASAVFANGRDGTPGATLPAAGQAYALPSVDELIAAELALNPGERVLGKASREAVDGETATRTFKVARDKPGHVEVYLDCLGPSSVTVTSGSQSVTSPCLRAGSYGLTIETTDPIIVTASGDTSWRVVLYSSP